MKIENFQEKQNKLLGRKEVTAVLVFEKATPKREEIKKKICERVGAAPDLSVLREVKTSYGEKKLTATLHVYEDAGKMKQVEYEYLLKRDRLIGEKGKEEPKAEEQPKEEKKPETKKEEKAEKKEEPKKEEKKEKPKEEKKGE